MTKNGVSLKRSEQKSWTLDKTIEICGLCNVRPCRSRYNVLCLKCLTKVQCDIQQQIRVFGPIVGSEVCSCDMRTKTVGDGCSACNPELVGYYNAD